MLAPHSPSEVLQNFLPAPPPPQSLGTSRFPESSLGPPAKGGPHLGFLMLGSPPGAALPPQPSPAAPLRLPAPGALPSLLLGSSPRPPEAGPPAGMLPSPPRSGPGHRREQRLERAALTRGPRFPVLSRGPRAEPASIRPPPTKDCQPGSPSRPLVPRRLLTFLLVLIYLLRLPRPPQLPEAGLPSARADPRAEPWAPPGGPPRRRRASQPWQGPTWRPILQTRELRFRGEVTCPRPHSRQGVGWGGDPGLWLPGPALRTSRRGLSLHAPAPARGSPAGGLGPPPFPRTEGHPFTEHTFPGPLLCAGP